MCSVEKLPLVEDWDLYGIVPLLEISPQNIYIIQARGSDFVPLAISISLKPWIWSHENRHLERVRTACVGRLANVEG